MMILGILLFWKNEAVYVEGFLLFLSFEFTCS